MPRRRSRRRTTCRSPPSLPRSGCTGSCALRWKGWSAWPAGRRRGGGDDQPVLRVRGLGKDFGANTVLDGINFDVGRGETVCVLGPSGSGKSTLLRCINWLERPDRGQVYLGATQVGLRPGGNVPMPDAELARLRTRVGMVFQHFALWPHMTVLQNITEAPAARPAAPARGGAGGGRRPAGEGRAAGQAGRLPGAAVRRAEAARRHRAGADDAPGAAAVRRADQRAGPRAGRGGPGRDAGPGAGGHDDGGGDARDGLRARCRDPGRFHGPRAASSKPPTPDSFFTAPQTDRARQFLLRYAGDASQRTPA